jgi:hypothetical protein
LQVGQREGALSVAAIGGAQQREKGGVLANGQELAIAEAQPVGAKFPAKIRISATNGFDMAIFSPLLVLAGENSLQRDNEIQHQVWAHVFMRLAATCRQNAGRVHGVICRG